MDRLPNLFLIGAAKGGSTSFATQLKDHPQIAFFAGKEPNIFNQGTPAACRAAAQDRLARKKNPLEDVPYLLDASVNYSQYPKFLHVPEHIAEICGRDTPRILYMVRNPVDRAISQYFWRRERYGDAMSADEAFTAESQYVQSSLYDQQIERYLSIFPATQCRFMVFEHYYSDVASAYAEVCRWLDIDDTHVPDIHRQRGATDKKMTRSARFPIVNRIMQASPSLRGVVKSLLSHERQIQVTRALSKSEPRQDVPPQIRARLEDIFAQSIERTEALIGQDLSIWKPPQ